mmetsp:Transcript_23859/g.36236  ORF Transcript_23859/g.36236 Transcript_23859/m.36236 type:complete len:672 (+) Transcript_23859:132-2147(+)
MTTNHDKPDFPEFKSDQVFSRPERFKLEVGVEANVDDDNDYTKHAYQFGMSTNPETCQPKKIIYAECEDDVMKAVKYAYDAGIALALRSGGHHYTAHSSTSDENMQIDLSKMKKVTQDGDSTKWTVEAGCMLKDFDEELKAEGMFIPHGECSTVALGGHLQTGGYAPCFSRSFGLFVDHCIQFTIILAPQEKGQDPIRKVVQKPAEGVNDELWYTILGGSPGNFGVITEAMFEVRKDEDHKDSRGVFFPCVYETPNSGKKNFEEMLKIACEYSASDNGDIASDFCFNVFHITGNCFEKDDLKKHKNVDTLMCAKHPEIYNKRGPATPPWVGLCLVWCNVEGKEHTFDTKYKNGKSAKDVFDEVRAKMHKVLYGDEDPVDVTLSKWKTWYDRNQIKEYLWETVDHFNEFQKMSSFLALATKGYNDPIPMSEMNVMLSFPLRIRGNPCRGTTLLGFEKNYCGNDHALSKWTAEIMDDAHWTKGIYPDSQYVFFGGENNKVRKENCGNNNVLAFRNTSFCFLDYLHYDIVYDNKDVDFPTRKVDKRAKDVVEELAGPDGKSGFFKRDSRWLAFPNHEVLDDAWEKYYETKKDYLRILIQKRKVDPTDVFTPNLFCVGSKKKYGEAKAGDLVLMDISELERELEIFENGENDKKRSLRIHGVDENNKRQKVLTKA